MRMKGILSVMAILLLAIVLCVCFTACEEEHVHSFSEWSTTRLPTCTVEGRQARSCSLCGEWEYMPIAALGHTEVADAAVAATCLNDGKTAGSHCGVCNSTLTPQTIIAATGHTAVTDAAVSPTCTANGKTEGSHCGACGATLVEQTVVNALGHQYDGGTVLTAATCVTQGTKRYTCTVVACRHMYNEPYSLATLTATEIYDRAVEYVAEITIYDKNGEKTGFGSGFVYSSDGKIMTNYHVIEQAYSATVTVNQRTYPVKSVLAFDQDIDLAVLKIDAIGLAVANVCKKPVKAGQTVFAIGSPQGQTNTLSQGIITYAKRELQGVSCVQHDAAVSHGNSGGPLINVYGEVIGINTFCVADSQNLNFAVFADEIDHLIFGTPISLADLYEMNHTPNGVLLNWLYANYTEYSGGQVYYSEEIEGALFIIGYDTEYGHLYVDAIWELEEGAVLYVMLDLFYDPSQYMYYASLSYGQNTNVSIGCINAATFTENTALTWLSYEGEYWDEALLMDLYRVGVVDLLCWLDCLTVKYDIGVTLEDMGFAVFEISHGEATADTF